jgi:hypothetical protein
MRTAGGAGSACEWMPPSWFEVVNARFWSAARALTPEGRAGILPHQDRHLRRVQPR